LPDSFANTKTSATLSFKQKNQGEKMRKLMIAALEAVTAIAASAAGNGQKTKTATTRIDDSFFTSGGLFTGVNYWASHAGTYMWRRWDAETVANDFAALSAQGVDTLRVFPL
jgi:hypothetical protein